MLGRDMSKRVRLEEKRGKNCAVNSLLQGLFLWVCPRLTFCCSLGKGWAEKHTQASLSCLQEHQYVCNRELKSREGDIWEWLSQRLPVMFWLQRRSASPFQQRITFDEVYHQNVPKYAVIVFPKALCPLQVVTIPQCINLLVPVYSCKLTISAKTGFSLQWPMRPHFYCPAIFHTQRFCSVVWL